MYDFNVKNGYKGSYDDFVSFAGAGQPSSPTDYTSAMGFKQPVGKQESLPIGIAAPKQEPDYSAIMSPQSISALDTPPMEAYRKRQERKRNEDYARSLGLEKTKEQPQEEPQQGFDRYLTKQEDKRADQQAFEDYTREAVEEANEPAELPSQWNNPITPEGRLDKMKRDAVKAEKIEKHNEALTRLAEQNGINLSKYDNLAEAGEEMRKLYDLTPSGKQDKEALERSVQLAQQDFINDYIKNGTDEELKAWLMAGETAEALKREGDALQREARYFNGTDEQAADLDKRIKDFEKKAERHNALLGKDMTQRFSEAFAPFLEKDEYYQATADKYNRNLAASTNPLYMKVTEPVRKQMADNWLAELTTELDEARPNSGSIREFAAAADILKDTMAFRNAANKNGLSTGLRSAYNTIADWGNATWGIVDAANQATVNDVMKKLDKDGYDKLKPAEQALVDAVAVQDLVYGLYNNDVNQTAWGMGETTAQMAQFIAELYVSGGLAGAARGAVKGGIKQGFKGIGKGWAEGWRAAQMSRQEAAQLGRIANKYTNKSAFEVAKNIGKKALKVTDTGLSYALTTGAGHSVANTLEYMAPELDFDYDFNTGEATYNGAKGGDRLGIAALKGFGKQAIEGATEVMGDEFFEPLVERGGAWLMRALGKGGRNAYKPYLRVVDNWVGGGLLKNIQGYGIEYGEELAGSVLRALTGISSWDEEFNKENLAQTAYGLMPAQIGFAMLGGGRMVGHNRRASRARALMEKYAPEQQDFYNRVAEMSTYDGADMLDRRTLDILETIDKKRADGTLTQADEQKAAAELGMIFATQEQLYMDEAAAYMDDKKQRSIYEGITSNINKDNGKFTVANWTHDGQTERVAVLSTKDGKATIKANGKKHTVDAKDISVQAEYTPEQAVELAAEANENDWRGMANEDQTTPRAGSIYYDAEGNTPIVPGGGRVMVTDVADNGDVTFETEAGRQQTMSRRQFYDYMRALRENYEDTAGEIEAWQTSETEVANTTAQSDNAMEHQVAGQAARDVERLLAQKIGADQVALLNRMDVEGITRVYLEAEDDTTRSLISAWLQTRTSKDYHNAMSKRKQDAVAGFKQSIGRMAYDNSGITTAEYNGNTVAVESNDGSNAVIVGLDGSKTMVPSASLANMQPSTLDAFAEQAVAPQLQQADALERVYDGTVFNEGQVYDMGIDKDGKPRKVAVVSVNPDGTISYATNYGWNKDGSLNPDSRSVNIVSAKDFRDMIETANEEAVEKAEGERQAAQQRADMGSLKAGQRVVIMDGGKPVGGVVMIPYTGQQAVFTDTQKLVNFDTIDDLKKSMQDAANATNTQQQAAIEAVANRINELAAAMPNARIKVVTDINELRPDAQEFAKQGRLEAYFDPDTNTVVFYAPGLVANNSNVDGKVIHEVVIHYGLKNMLGEKDYAALCLNIFNNVMDENDRAQYVQYVKDTHPNSNLTDEQIMAMAADEWLAFTYENRDIDSIKRESLLQTIVNFIVDFFKRAGVDLNRDEVMAELDQLVAASRDWLRGEQVNKEEKKEEAPKEEEKKEEPQPEPTKTREELIANAVQAAANFAAQGDPNFVKDNLDKAKKRVSNVKKRKPTSTDPAKRQEQIEKINNELVAAESELAFWNDVQAVINEASLAGQTRLNEADQALQELEANLNPTVEAEEVHKFDKEPANADEAAADFLVGFVKKEHRINEQSLMQNTNWSEDEVKNFRPATTPDGGMTLWEAAENLYNEYESEGSEHGWFKDPSEARDKLISVMQEAGKYGELANYINQRRGNDEATQQMQAALDYNAQQLGYADAQDMHDKRMAEAQAKLEELKDEQGNLSEEALQQFKDFTKGLMIGQEETPTETPTESVDEGEEFIQPTNEEAPFSVVLPIDQQTPKNTTIDQVLYSIKVNHNSPYLVKRADGSFIDPVTGERLGFDHRFIGTGEGNQAHGWGSYFSVNDLRTYGGQLGGNNVKYKGKDYYDSGLQPIALVELQLNDGNVEAARKELESRIEEAENLGEPYVGTWMLDNVPIRNAKIALEQLSNPKDFEFDRHHYEVEIPDNDGTNYIEERQKPSIEDLQRVVNVMSEDEKSSIEPAVSFDKDGYGVEVNTINDLVGTLNYYVENGGLKDLYEVALFIENDGYRSDPKEASRLLRDAGFIGIHYDGMRDGECYVIFDENDAKIVDHVMFSVTGNNAIFADIINEQGELNYDRLNEHIQRVKDGTERVSRLSEEEIRREDATPSIAAQAIARGVRGSRFYGLWGADKAREQTRLLIKEWAKKNKYWYGKTRLEKDATERKGNNKESRVFISNDYSIVRKLTKPFLYTYTQSLIEAIESFGSVFPETAYTIKGFAENKDGQLCVVTEQPYIDGVPLSQAYPDATEREKALTDFMEDLGFNHYGYGVYGNNIVGVYDLHGGNVIVDANGDLFVIDAIIRTSQRHFGDDVMFSVTGLITNEQGEIDYDRVTNLAENNEWQQASRIPRAYRLTSVPANAATIISQAVSVEDRSGSEASRQRGDVQGVRQGDRGDNNQGQPDQGGNGTPLGNLADTIKSDIEAWAKSQGYWYDEARLTDGFTEIEGGTESRVFVNADKTKARKLTSYPPAYGEYMQLLMENIGIFNATFPDAAYEVIGFGKDKNGNLAAVVEQPYIEGRQAKDRTEVVEAMRALGFRPFYDEVTFTNGRVFASDVNEKNMVIDTDGKPHVIDAVMSLRSDLYDNSDILYSVVTPQQDADYMDAVNRGDMETAQRMVMEAAKAAMPNTKVVDENGNPLVVYHSYDNENYNSGLVFASADESYSREFGDNTDKVYINLTNPYITEDGILRDANGNEVMYEGEPASIGYLDSVNDDYLNWLQSNYDGIMDKDMEFVVAFNPNQIKSADPVTYDDQGNVIPLSERFNPNNDDIRYSISPESQAIFDKAKEIFGTTSNINEAGYILPDGAMLDFSGRKDLDEGTNDDFLRGRRTEDHRDIQQIEYEKDGNTPSGVNTDMPDFIRRGAIRIDSNAGVINLAMKPTQQQRWPIRRIVEANDGDVQVDFGDGWDSDHYVEYDGAKPSRVLADIDRYFDEGVKPEGNMMFSIVGQVINRNGDINYEELDNIIRSQRNELAGLSRIPEEAVGRAVATPAIAAEAIARGVRQANLAEVWGEDRAREHTRELIKQWAKQSGYWYDETRLKEDATEGRGGTESRVFVTNNGKTVRKLTSPVFSQGNVEPYIESLHLFGNVFGESAYDIKGFGENDKGELCVVIEQPYIQGVRLSDSGITKSIDKIREFMESLGFKEYGVSMFENDKYRVEDVNRTNVIVDTNGDFHVIDAYVSLADESLYKEEPMYSFVGRSGAQRLDMADRAMTRLNNLHVAREMEEQGKDAKAVKMATGWERGKDGKWRYEIAEASMEDIVKRMREPILPKIAEIKRLKELARREYEKFEYLNNNIPARLDSRFTEEEKQTYREQRKERDKLLQSSHANKTDAEVIEGELRNDGVEMTLGEILPEGNELLKAYPQLADIKVRYYNRETLRDGSYGRYNDKTNTLFIAAGKERPVTEIYSALYHEIQHAIQDIEGFAQGGNPQMAAQAVKDMDNNAKVWEYKMMLDDVAQENPGHADSEQELLYDILFDHLLYENDGQAEYNAVRDGWIPEENLRKQAFKIYQGKIKGDSYEKAHKQWYDKLNEAGRTTYYEGTPFELYKRLAGETEARNVQTRLGFTDEQRRQLLAAETEDVAREDQLVMFAGDPVLYSVAKNANTPQERMALYDALVGTKNETSTFVGRTMENAYQYILDGAIPLKRLQTVVAGRNGVKDAENAYLMEIARASRAKYLTDQAEKKYMQPMMDAIADLTGKQSKRGFYKAMRDVELYILAKSGLERNQWFWDEAKKEDPNAQLEDKSGLTALAAQFGETDFTAFAERLVAEYEAKHGKQKIDNLWNAIRNMSHNILDTERDGMLISAELCEDLKNRWQYYVPMRGFDEDVTSSVYSYDPSSANIRFENPFKKIKGRVSLADNPFVNLWRMTESAINLKGKNEVGLALLTLASNHPDNGLIRVGKSWETRFIDPNTGEEKWMMAYPNLANVSQKDIPAAIDAFQKSMVRMAKTGDARQSNSRTAGGMRIFPTDMDQHTLKVTVAGQSVDLYLMGSPKAFQSLNPNGKNRTAQAMSALTRGLSGLMTTYNPVFMVRNSMRDLGTAMIITYTRDGVGGMATMLGQWFVNANKLRRLISGKSSGDATIDQYWNEFLEFGGETGFTRSLAMEKARDEFMKDMRNATRKGINPNAVLHAYGNWMENYGNRFAEDITRFAVFCASRKNGKSAMQAVNDAKNTTANFNKKGNSAFTRFMTSNFAFFNAALQGLNTTFHAYKDNPGRAAVASVSTMAFSMALPFINMCMLAMFGDDDDWRQYENMTQFIGNTHLVIYIPRTGFATLPFPQDFVPLTALGNIIWRNASGFSNLTDERSIAGNIMLEWASTMADLLPVNMFEEGFGKIEDWEGVARAIAPTWLSPVADVMLNRNFMGSMIRRKHFLANGQKDLKPYWAEYDRNKSEWAYELAKLIAGGDEYRAAAEWRNIDPRQIIHIVEGYGGGTVKLISDAVNYATARAKGENASINQSPFIKKFWIQPQPDKYEGNLNGKLYEMAKHQRDMEQELKSLQKEADKAYDDGNDALAEKREKEIERIENSIEYQVLSAYDVNGMMESWREQRNDITADEELSDEGKQEQIRSLTYEKAAFLDGIWEELFLNGDKSNWFSEFYRDASTEAYTHYRDKKGEQE